MGNACGYWDLPVEFLIRTTEIFLQFSTCLFAGYLNCKYKRYLLILCLVNIVPCVETWNAPLWLCDVLEKVYLRGNSGIVCKISFEICRSDKQYLLRFRLWSSFFFLMRSSATFKSLGPDVIHRSEKNLGYLDGSLNVGSFFSLSYFVLKKWGICSNLEVESFKTILWTWTVNQS